MKTSHLRLPTLFNPDETLCDCGHPRKQHSLSLRGRLPCMFEHPSSGEPCHYNALTITVTAKVSTEHLAGRLTEEDIVDAGRKKRDAKRIADSRRD